MGGSLQKTESQQDGLSSLGRAQGSVKSAAMLGAGSMLGPEGSRPRRADSALLLSPPGPSEPLFLSHYVLLGDKDGDLSSWQLPSQSRPGMLSVLLQDCYSASTVVHSSGRPAAGPPPGPHSSCCWRLLQASLMVLPLPETQSLGYREPRLAFRLASTLSEPPFPVHEVSMLN